MADHARPDAPESPEVKAPAVHEDESPALATVDPQFGENPMENVDLSGLPDFRSLSGMLPAARFHIKRQLADISEMVPDDWADEDGNVNEEKAAEVDSENLAAMDDMMQAAEKFVLDMAKDREAMTKWLIEQDNGEASLMAAFSHLGEHLGNS